MGDMCDTQEILLLSKGMESEILSNIERENNDISKHSHADRDKKVHCQFESVAVPAERLCMFLQDTGNA